MRWKRTAVFTVSHYWSSTKAYVQNWTVLNYSTTSVVDIDGARWWLKITLEHLNIWSTSLLSRPSGLTVQTWWRAEQVAKSSSLELFELFERLVAPTRSQVTAKLIRPLHLDTHSIEPFERWFQVPRTRNRRPKDPSRRNVCSKNCRKNSLHVIKDGAACAPVCASQRQSAPVDVAHFLRALPKSIFRFFSSEFLNRIHPLP